MQEIQHGSKEAIAGRNLIETVKHLVNKTVPIKKQAEQLHPSDLQFLESDSASVLSLLATFQANMPEFKTPAYIN